jgi:MFS superfamily sulfate permease-like transporter
MVVGLTAVVLGTLVAMVLFIRSNVKRPVRQVAHGDRRRSRKVRPEADSDRLHREGKRSAVVELDGALFFGTAEAADEQIEHLIRESVYIIIDFGRVTDVTPVARASCCMPPPPCGGPASTSCWRVSRRGAPTRLIRDMDVHAHLMDAQFFPMSTARSNLLKTACSESFGGSTRRRSADTAADAAGAAWMPRNRGTGAAAAGAKLQQRRGRVSPWRGG